MVLGTWVVIVTALVLIVPGALVGRRMDLPWTVALAVGPTLTYGLVGIFSVLYSAIGVSWNGVSALVGLAVAMLVAWGYSTLLGTRVGRRVASAPEPRDEPQVGRIAVIRMVAGLVVGAVIIAVSTILPLVRSWAGLNTPSQIWDSLWHASSLRWIHETGVASPLRMGELMNYDTHGFNFYPNAWHALGSLLYPLTGANTVELYNAYSSAALAVTVPLGVGTLGYWFARHRYDVNSAALIAALGAAFAGLFPSLPYVELDLTSVPNAVGVSLGPVAAVLTISALRDRRRVLPAALSLAGVGVTHPSGLILAAVLVVLWWVCEGLWRPVVGRLGDFATLAVIGVITLVPIAPVAYGTLRAADSSSLPAYQFRVVTVGFWEALAQSAFSGTVPLTPRYPVWPLVVLTVLGLVALAWMRCWVGLAAWVLFVLVTANAVVSLGPLESLLGIVGGNFYNSPHRLTFVVSMISSAAVGAVLGVVVLWGTRKLDERVGEKRSPVAASVALFVVALVGISAGAWAHYGVNSSILMRTRTERFVGQDDLDAYHWLAAQPDVAGTVVLNNLDQGTGWLYPVTGVRAMFPFYQANDFSQRQRDLFWAPQEIGANPHIDQIVRDLDVRYVIDSPPSYWEFQRGVPDPARGYQGDPFLALRNGGAPGLDIVFRQGNVTIYRVKDSVLAKP